MVSVRIHLSQIVHTIQIEKYGASKKWVIVMDKRQDKNAARRVRLPKTSGPSAQNCYCTRGSGGGAKNLWRRGNGEEKSSSQVVMFMLRVMTYVDSYKLFCNWIDVAWFVSHEVWSNEEFVIWHLLHCFFSTCCVLVITEYLNWQIIFNNNELALKIKKTLK